MKRGMPIGVIVSLGLLCGISHAGVIALDSQPGLSNSLTSGTVAITAHPIWQQRSHAVWRTKRKFSRVDIPRG